ncbi:Receptor-type guanylate cyclase gcy [Seminavis robusta]|uniref:Receptor-type guanylate cyclase gcy n=2 Tax=Seminavis robusta TaxID=568900 RepID=A0A9N8F132_9STRA|nr:Receptor-type guanylate cyclase gcy [Seminavis robusta]|eukprot:Sro2942_g340720.1 Receptor-type guanylate cyclase gcy (841) ;mRNA; r:1246-4360
MVTLTSENSSTEHTPTVTTCSTGMKVVKKEECLEEGDFSSRQFNNDASGDGMHTGNGGTRDLYTELEVAKKEDRWVFWLRILTTLVLLAVAVTVCVVVYLEGRKSETKSFEQDFSDLGEKMVQSFEAKVEQRFGVIDAFAESVTSDANHSFPYVTPPNYAFRAETAATLAQLFFIIFIPIVQKEQLETWNQYVQQNEQQWRVEGWAQVIGANPEDVNVTDVGFYPMPPQMMNFHNPNGPGPVQKVTPDHTLFYPVWCTWPLNPSSAANVDMYGDVDHRVTIDTTLETGKPTFEVSHDYLDEETEKDGRYGLLKSNRNFDYQDDPHALAWFPIFDKFSYIDSNSDPDPPRVSGLFLVIVYWRTYFDDLLPPGSDGIFVILENTCDQVYTYRVDGTSSLFVGHGDLHDPKYDYLEAGTSIGNVINATVPDDNQNGCHYSIRVYPSQDFEDDHRTDKPWIYVLVLASLFLFTSAVFLIYDNMVERRQKIVLQSAQQSGKLVSTLFPEDVRDQLYQDQQEEAQKNQKRKGWENKTVSNNPATDALVNSNASPLDSNMELGKKVIASLYPESTIYFADLVGFTSWSAKRTPVEVFQLLETLYGAFDNVALKRDVFKVETIGDCYVAATGLPQPQPNHAVIMCKFATDCMNKMKVIVSSLADTMGEDTADLAMRVGLHSGPVTAGVLRGQKSRFQLFGDTVNTASRMESNGLPHRIHVSQETADALRAKGKEVWLTPRPDKVQAKGKGLLQTYFVDTTSKSRSVVSGLTLGDTTVGSDMDMDNDMSHASGSTENAPQHSHLPDDLAGLTIVGAGGVVANEHSNHDSDITGRGDETQGTALGREFEV